MVGAFLKLSGKKIRFHPRTMCPHQMTATWRRASIQAHLPDVVVLEAAEKGQDRLTLTPVVGF
jgi:hypothetical protein